MCKYRKGIFTKGAEKTLTHKNSEDKGSMKSIFLKRYYFD